VSLGRDPKCGRPCTNYGPITLLVTSAQNPVCINEDGDHIYTFRYKLFIMASGKYDQM